MPRQKKPTRLWFKESEQQWIILPAYIRTGCGRGEHEQAHRKLAEHIAPTYEDQKRHGDPHETPLGDVLTLYTEAKVLTVARPKDLVSRTKYLIRFWGNLPVSAIKGASCRAYAAQRTSPSMARRELEDMRSALHFYDREYGLDKVPVVTLPPKPKGRTRWLTRNEAARLLWAARHQPHLARLILIALYTGTRSGAVLSMQWYANTTSGYADLERELMYRAGIGERVASNKRRPPVKINSKLLAHMKRWHKNDQGLRHVVHWRGERVESVRRAFRNARIAAGLDDSVTPHVLRHTSATWLMQAGVPIWQASGFLGMTTEILESTYGHHSPDYQKGAANAY